MEEGRGVRKIKKVGQNLEEKKNCVYLCCSNLLKSGDTDEKVLCFLRKNFVFLV